MVEIFRENFETGSTTMAINQTAGYGQVNISSERPISETYSAQCIATFDPTPGWKWTSARLRQAVSLPTIIVEALIRVEEYSRAQTRVLGVDGDRAYLVTVGFQFSTRNMYIMINGVGTISLGRTWNIGEVYHIKVYVKCPSTPTAPDEEVRVWINDEVVYENSAILPSEYSLLTGSIQVGIDCSWGDTSVVNYGEAWVDDVIIDDLSPPTPPPPPTHNLTVNSTPQGIPFILE